MISPPAVHISIVFCCFVLSIFSWGMGSSDEDEPFHGFTEQETPPTVRTRRTRRRGRGASSSTSRERESPAPYPQFRRRSVSAEPDQDVSLEWDGIMERNQARLRSQSYVNQLGPLSNRDPRSPAASYYRIFMASPRADNNAGKRTPRRGEIRQHQPAASASASREANPPPDGADHEIPAAQIHPLPQDQ